MTLINRVSAFFLLALGVCLIGYSTAVYVLIREHLFHQFDAHLRSSLNVLVAAVEVEPDGVKWQPSDHTITLGNEREEDEVRWVIVDEAGRMVDESHNLKSPNAEDQRLLTLAQSGSKPVPVAILNFGQWRYLQHRLTCPEPKPAKERDPDESAELTVTVAREAERLHADVWRLGLLASILPLVLWCIAAVTGRSYCRRALRPVGAMADRARSMTNADFDLRLPDSGQADELSSLSAAFNSLLDRLQQAYEQQQRFTGDAAHQLRTPLTILRGQIDVALRRPREAEEYRQLLELLGDQTRELQQIVETLLFLARNEDADSQPDRQTILLQSWLPDFLNHWRNDARFADLQWQVTGAPVLHVNDSLLRQAVENLISNALKYSPRGSPVQVDVHGDSSGITITVEDRGSGIAPGERSAIFDPFYRSASARQTGVAGTGLGLALVARIARALGGSIRYEPASPQGSRFILQFPQQVR